MTEIDVRCCGDHPRDWDRPAVPGTGWCAECLTRLRVTCPTPCDDDCDAGCHEWHQPRRRRTHQPEDCPGERTRD